MSTKRASEDLYYKKQIFNMAAFLGDNSAGYNPHHGRRVLDLPRQKIQSTLTEKWINILNFFFVQKSDFIATYFSFEMRLLMEFFRFVGM